MPIRVIAGTARGRRLKMVPGEGSRPVMDRVKEACFSKLGRRVAGSRFLDLYAGTGSVAIEALSRGAALAVLTEQDPRALRVIRENLQLAGVQDRARVQRADVLSWLRNAPAQPFDIIYIAPPQYLGLWSQTLQLIEEQPCWTHEDSIVVVQIDPSERQGLELDRLAPVDERRYGNTLLWYFQVSDEAGKAGDRHP
ncbi:MAG: 16S rRNA (guanine(966)-N(2))-methyltransferase RsmD [Anaerolineaceae bacterium]|nr:16S rRNA (guanine(966)-N(2))-methyltransferase RsmD [Anaerolineaceae bacterium]